MFLSSFLRRLALAVLCVLLLTISLSLTMAPQAALAQSSTVSINPTQGPAGTHVTGTGANWTTGDQIQISWADDGSILTNTIVQSNGTFTVSFTIPSSSGQGAHNIYFTDLNSRYFLVAVFTVATVAIQTVWTCDSDGKAKTSFISGEAIRYNVLVKNGGSTSVTATFTFLATGPGRIFSWQGNATVTVGTASFYSPTIIPDNAPGGTYAFQITVTYSSASSTKTSQFTVTVAPPESLLAPFNKGDTFHVLTGYYNNRDQSMSGCHIGTAPDHCDNQLFGLDLRPDQQSDYQVLAPTWGKVAWVDSPPNCIGLTLNDNFNLTVCHFSSVNVKVGDQVQRGKILGTRKTSTQHVHLSIDNRNPNGPCNQCLPIPFNVAKGGHTFEATSLNPNHDGKGETVTYASQTFIVEFNEWTGTGWTSTNTAI